MYDMLKAPTIPGTETNVTPDILVPIIPIATIYQGDLRLATKKASLSELFRLINIDIRYNIPKYAANMIKMFVAIIAH